MSFPVIENLRIPWQTALQQDNNFNVSRDQLEDPLNQLEVWDIGPGPAFARIPATFLDWAGLDFNSVGLLNGIAISSFLTTLAGESIATLNDVDNLASTGNQEGDIFYWDGTSWNRFQRGADGTFLKSTPSGITWGTGSAQSTVFADDVFQVFSVTEPFAFLQFDLSLYDPSAPVTNIATWPNKSGTVAFLDDITAATTIFRDSPPDAFELVDDKALTPGLDQKQGRFDVSGITAGQLRTLAFPDQSGVIALITDIVTSNEFNDNVFRVRAFADITRKLAFDISGNVAAQTLTIATNASVDKQYSIPDAADLDEFVMETFAQTLQNKTIDNTNTVDVGALPATVVLNDQANTFLAGFTQSVEHDATNPGLRIIPAVGDPSVLLDGHLWYNSSTQQILGRINGANVDMGSVTPQDSSFVITCTGEAVDLVADLVSPTTTFRMTFPFVLNTGTGLTLGVRASVRLAPVGSDIIVDIKQNNVSILSAPIHIDPTDFESVSSATQATILTSALTDNAEIEVFVTQIGSTTPGQGLKVYLIGSS